MSDCKNCKHLVMYDYKNKSYSCELGECEFEPEEQEPTTKNDLGVDLISRADLYNRIKTIDHDEDYECDEYGGNRITYHTCDWDEVLREIEDAPSVTPQEPKTGHWNDIPKYKDIAWCCSECERFTTMKHNYCPKCGAKMVEPQESEG